MAENQEKSFTLLEPKDYVMMNGQTAAGVASLTLPKDVSDYMEKKNI